MEHYFPACQQNKHTSKLQHSRVKTYLAVRQTVTALVRRLLAHELPELDRVPGVADLEVVVEQREVPGGAGVVAAELLLGELDLTLEDATGLKFYIRINTVCSEQFNERLCVANSLQPSCFCTVR